MKPSAGVIAVGEGYCRGGWKRATRKRPVGTREHIVAYLAEIHELFDASGMASTRLATAVGYPGSSVAFAQLLSGMERAGLIEREVRGKRTYRISLGRGRAFGTAEANEPRGADGLDDPGGLTGPGASVALGGLDDPGALAGSGGLAGLDGMDSNGAGPAGFDYDELARRLLVQVVRRLAAAEPKSSPVLRGAAGMAEENVRLREQLEAAQHALALAAERLRKLPITAGLDRGEIMMLQRLLSAGGGRLGTPPQRCR
jgi:hypothetical protein